MWMRVDQPRVLVMGCAGKGAAGGGKEGAADKARSWNQRQGLGQAGGEQGEGRQKWRCWQGWESGWLCVCT